VLRCLSSYCMPTFPLTCAFIPPNTISTHIHACAQCNQVYSRETDETEFIPDKSALLGRVENQAVEERELSPIPISQQHESSSLSAASSVTPRASLVDSPNTAQPGSLRASPQHLSSQSPSPPPTTSSPSSVTNSSAISPCKSSKPPPSPKATEADQALQRILLVEDNKSTLLIMCRLLQQRGGYHVTTASTVAGALEVGSSHSPPLSTSYHTK